MSRMFNTLREEHEMILKIKNISPDGKLPRGILLDGKPAIKHALEKQVKFIEQMDEQENFQDNMTDEFNELLELLIEKDPLVVHLDNSKDFMDLGINKLETEIGKAINTEWNEILREMLEKQHKRNRNIIKEIIDTCETFRKGIKEDFTNLKGEEEDN